MLTLDENLRLVIFGNVTLSSRETLQTYFFFFHTAIMRDLIFPIAYMSTFGLKDGCVSQENDRFSPRRPITEEYSQIVQLNFLMIRYEIEMFN